MPYKKGMEALLKQEKGMAAVLVPGGALEALNSDKDQIRLVLNRRKGFIKLALRYSSMNFLCFCLQIHWIHSELAKNDIFRCNFGKLSIGLETTLLEYLFPIFKFCTFRFGVNLVPTFSFGENFIYDQVKSENGTFLRWFQELAEKWIGFIPVMFFGRGIFQYNYGIIPHRSNFSIKLTDLWPKLLNSRSTL